jgi:ATP-binding cassette, subfamily F, member 3
MIELAVNNLTMQFGETTIFEKITFDVKSGERVGLIGANGSGKTTLMKIIMNLEKPATGDVFLRKGLSIGYLNQIPQYEETVIVKDVILLAFHALFQLKERLSQIEQNLAQSNDDGERLLKQYGELSHRFEESGGYMIDTEFNKIVKGLNISDTMLEQNFAKLSGGEQTRIVLAKILLEKPDILMLDEPSNHLDMKSIEWLEDYLRSYSGAILIISHDRYFLDQAVNRIVELTYDEAIVYHGNYTYYTVEKERRFLLEMKYYEQQQKKIKRMEDQIKRYRIWGEMRDSDKMFVRAKELEKRLEKMEKVKKPIYELRKISLNMDIQDRTGNKVIRLEGISKQYGPKSILCDAELYLNFRDFACLLGENGSGKTTLFKLIMNELTCDSGVVHLGSRVKIGYLPQQIEFENEEISVVEYFQYCHEISQSEARKELAKALFVKDEVFKQVKVLSGGEKSRLKLATLLFSKVNVLLLDEPTNHLDIDSREVLEENLLEFEGTILFISHDRYFVDKLATKIFELEKGSITTYPMNYQDYKETKAKHARASLLPLDTEREHSALTTKAKMPQEPSTVKGLSKNQERRLMEIESSIEALEKELAHLESSLIDIGHDHEALRVQMTKIDSSKTQISELYEEWEKLQFENN